MHYYLADRQAHAAQPGARAILLDSAGHVCETSTANVVMFHEAEGLVSPREGGILPGISLLTLASLAAQLRIPYRQRDIEREELFTADELILTSTSVCMLPVVRCDGRAVGGGVPGKVFRQLLAAWSAFVGVDIEAQAARFAGRRSRP
jgi:branched-subunit amino acid aminotransferase/4-amino-4-deoxychorismate lyase